MVEIPDDKYDEMMDKLSPMARHQIMSLSSKPAKKGGFVDFMIQMSFRTIATILIAIGTLITKVGEVLIEIANPGLFKSSKENTLDNPTDLL